MKSYILYLSHFLENEFKICVCIERSSEVELVSAGPGPSVRRLPDASAEGDLPQ